MKNSSKIKFGNARAKRVINKRNTQSTETLARYRRRKWTVYLLLVLGCVGSLVYYAVQSTQKMPDFYQTALNVDREIYRAAGRRFETQILQLNSDIRAQSEWTAVFSQDQVNGWLAVELPENFPESIPPEMDQPRVALLDDEVQLAFRFTSSRFCGIVKAIGNIFCTEDPNHIAIEIRQVRSGVFPLPIELWADGIKHGCDNAGITMYWTQKDGNPVAIVELPERFLDIRDRRIRVESIQLRSNEIVMSGTSTPIDANQREIAKFSNPRRSSNDSQATVGDQVTHQR
ncbi:MAG TPA: hypothetical protein PKD64_04600 [Pirellulaceae bacterium]|nr:hypothetical protein [Pirellulaceae bacterium]HMO91453.1 hypothetical protein [Pirellulaceae bacterium]HMP69470.1 hypothetical protein [Pirellulaceae bacterium]